MYKRQCLDSLEPLLRIYEGCARALVGELDDANVIKLHRFSGKVSYITYDGFDKNPHPPLKERMKVSLRSLNIDWFDYSNWDDPYLLIGKTNLINESYEKFDLFRRLESAESKHGLTFDSEQIRNSSLTTALREIGIELRGHRVAKITKRTPP